MKRPFSTLRPSLFSLALAVTCSSAPLACGDDDDGSNPGTAGTAGTAGTSGAAGRAGSPQAGRAGAPAGAAGDAGAGGAGSSGAGNGGSAGNGNACVASEGLARPASIACGKLHWRCAAPFRLANDFKPGITSVEVRGNYRPGAWDAGEPLTLNGTTWEGTIDAAYGNVEYKFFVKHEGKPDGEWYGDPANPVTDPGNPFSNSVVPNQCAQPTCPAQLPAPDCTPPGAIAGAFDWRDAVIYFPFVDRFMDGDLANDAPLPSGLPDEPGGLVAAPGNYQGGDYAGLKLKLDEGYFDALGVNVFWLTVPFDNPDTFVSFADRDQFSPGQPGYYEYTGYHGYWPMDQWPAAQAGVNRAEERFGTEAELKGFIDAAHLKGMKVLFDYAMVHLHESSPLYAEHPDWFTPKYAVNEAGNYINGDNVPILVGGLPVPAATYQGDPALLPGAQECLCGTDVCAWDGTAANPKIGERCWFQGYLPHVDYKKAEALEYSMQSAVRLAQEMGADGYRLDAVKHIDQAWYVSARTRLDALSPTERFYLVGETYDFGNRDNIKRFIGPDKLDGQFDFPERAQLANAVLKRGMAMSDLARFMESNDGYYDEPKGGTCNVVMSPFIGNHDMGRAIHVAEDTPRWSETDGATNYGWLGTPNQADVTPSAYERLANAFAVLLTNRGAPLIYYGDEFGLAGGGDPDNRRLLFNPDGTLAAPASEAQLALNARVQRLGTLRREHPALRRGARTTLNFSNDVWVYAMTSAEESLVIAVNRGDSAQTICDLPDGALSELVEQRELSGPSDALPPRQARIYQRKP